MTAVAIGRGPNAVEIPLLVFVSTDDAHAYLQDLGLKRDTLGDNFTAEYLEDKGLNPQALADSYTTTLVDGRELSEALEICWSTDKLITGLFAGRGYYSGCGALHQVEVREIEMGKPMIAWDLD